MGGHIECVGGGKANSVIVREDGTRDVIDWQLGNHKVPAVHRVRATVVRYPVQYYVHANYGPEVMAVRSESIARLRWSTRSFDMPLPPEIVGHFNLLRQAVAVVYKELRESPTRVHFLDPTKIEISSPHEWQSRFVIYLNVSGREFYDLLFIVGSEYGPSSQFEVAAADVGSCPKLLAWLRRFEAAKKKLYLTNGFDWNPRRGPIELGPTGGDL